MAADADVLIENYRPDVKHRLGIDYETLHAINPRLVYVSLSGFGQTGPYANRPGFDQIAQGMGGLMSITGLPGQGPVRVGIPIADLSRRQLRGHGRVHRAAGARGVGRGPVGADLAAAGADLPCSTSRQRAGRWRARCRARPATTIRPRIPTGVFPTSDGHINIAASGQHIFTRLCKALGAERCSRIPTSPPARSARKNRKRLNAEIGEYTRRYGSLELVEKLNAAGVPSGPDLLGRPDVRRSAGASTSAWRCRCRTPRADRWRSSTRRWRCRARPRSSTGPTPALGEHTDEVLADLGYDEAAIADLRSRKVI